MREVVHGVAHGLTPLAVGPTNPKTAVVLGVIKANTGRLELLCQVMHADPSQHFGGGAVGGHADHAGEGIASGCVELHVAGFDAGEGTKENGDFGQACGIHHVVGIEGGEAGVVWIGDVGKRH